MGRKTLAKKEKELVENQKVKEILLAGTKKLKKEKEVLQKPLVKDIEAFRPLFIRSEENFVLKTKSKDRTKQLKELVRHVFHKYPVPDFLFDAWETENYNKIRKQFDFKKWYICVATGGSLYKEHTKEILTKKETHTFLTCAHNINIEQSLVYAIAKCEGASDGVALRIARSKINDRVISEYSKQNIRWFAKNPPASVQQLDDLVDYLLAKKVEQPNFSLVGSGLTIDSLLKRMHDWHYDLRRLKMIGNSVWDGHPINDTEYPYIEYMNANKVECAWYFYQIKSAKELQEEGNAQRHCVLSYKKYCISGEASIWSLRQGYTLEGVKKAKRRLTIELRNNGVIQQVRGLANRKMKAHERTIIEKWSKDNALTISNYV